MKRSLVTLGACALLLAACGEDRKAEPTVTFATVPQSSTPSSTDSTPVDSTPTGTDSTTTLDPGPPAADKVQLTQFATGLQRPIDLVWHGADPDPYVVQQGGVIARVTNGQVGATVLDLTAKVSTATEQGVLGLAFHPTQPLAYVDYTNGKGDTTIAEYHVNDDGSFDLGSARVVLINKKPHDNHNGGKLVFGPDGYLYIGTGDGGSGGDPDRRALDAGQLHGKILRIDPVANGSDAYTIPADNPFAGVDGARGEIWSVGLRNPWRFTFDPATGDLWIGDVGQNEWEEVDVAWAATGGGRAVNFGWSAMEATHRFNTDQPTDGITGPVYEYFHDGANCAVSGGAVNRNEAIPSLVGWYVFADWCSGMIWALHTTPDTATYDGKATVVQIGQQGMISAIVNGPDGSLYVIDHGSGAVYRIDPA